MKIAFISDTHNYHKSVAIPPCDVLVHCGDFSSHGRRNEVTEFLEWFVDLEPKYKAFICGNHERGVQNNPTESPDWMHPYLSANVIYLDNSSVIIDGLNFYGSAWTPAFCGWAFQLHTPEEAKACWDKIPDNTDVLITHGPPRGYGDWVDRGELVGCKELIKAIDRVKPKVASFGHIHCGHGVYKHGPTTLINAAICNEEYRPVQPPIVFDTDTGEYSFGA